MTRKIERLNEALLSADIRSSEGADLTNPIVRIFNLDLHRGGRLYAQGASWQNLPSSLRADITIDDEPVMEVDYKTLHPALLYGEVCATPPLDAYDIGDPWDRKLVKKALLAAINAKNKREAVLAIAYAREMGPNSLHGSAEALMLARKLLEAIEVAHTPIAKAFYSGAGLRLMRTDSEIALRVLTKMTASGVVTLPVHDSFLVPASKVDDLEVSMEEAAAAHGLKGIRMERKKAA